MTITRPFNPRYKYSKNRKTHQRMMNTVMRRVNRNIEKDDLWRGRFVVRQVFSSFYQYEDKSGYDLYVVLQFRDKRTGQTYEIADSANSFCFLGGSKIYYEMNKFITEIADVWLNEGRDFLYSDKTDYTKLP